jgi:hypothetical protein
MSSGNKLITKINDIVNKITITKTLFVELKLQKMK